MSAMPDTPLTTTPRHPIRVVASRTGLSPDTLRVWERRYGVVQPGRSDGGQRLYSDADVERLTLLVQATGAGRNISQVADLSDAELERLVAEDEAAAAPPGGGAAERRPEERLEAAFLDAALAAVTELAPEKLDAVLRQAAFAMGATRFIEALLAPLLHEIGRRWEAGELGPAYEHAASAVIRRRLEWLAPSFDLADDAPMAVIATPPEERHELGAMLAAAVAAAAGWRVTYLGADLPPAEIAGAARRTGAGLVALSVVYPAHPDRLGADIQQIRKSLPAATPLVIGGHGAAALDATHRTAGIRYLPTLEAFDALLRNHHGTGTP
jgi:DNA-binding transcriptional MerR regulator/methylmalonyl-CoA mutase cobalamin-binding subunit